MKSLLKKGSPILVDFYFSDGGHAVAGTQFISYNKHDIWLLYDNNLPIYNAVKYAYAPYLQYYISDNSDYSIYSVSHINNQIILISPRSGQKIKDAYVVNNIFSTIMTSIPQNCTPAPYYSPDPQNIHRTRAVSSQQTKTIDYLPTNHAKVFLVGGKIEKVIDTSTGKEVALKPIRTRQLQPSVAYILKDTTIYLPKDKVYKVYARKTAGFPFLKLFKKVPNSNGTIEIANYENLQKSQADATRISFYVGENNSNKIVQREGASSYQPDFDQSFDLQVPPPTDFTGYVDGDEIKLTWENPTNPNFSKVIIKREKLTPSVVYEGAGEFCMVQINYESAVEPVRFSIVSVDQNGNQSKKRFFTLDTNRKYIIGSVNNANIPHMQNTGVSGRR